LYGGPTSRNCKNMRPSVVRRSSWPGRLPERHRTPAGRGAVGAGRPLSRRVSGGRRGGSCGRPAGSDAFSARATAGRDAHRTEPPSESLPRLEISLIEYVRARQDRDRLTALNRRLVPDHPPPPDEPSQSLFPRLAEEAFEVATWLIRQERRHPQYAPVLDEF